MEQNIPDDVITRFLRPEERLMLSNDATMPWVIEAKASNDLAFLTHFLSTHSSDVLSAISQYGAVLLRGFAIHSDLDFEKAVLSIQGLKGIKNAFMAEAGRVGVDGTQYVLHSNAAYKTGGTLYLGGFHSENYYSPDVPAYICFHCQKPSLRGGETGLIHMGKVYQQLNKTLQAKLEAQTFFVSKWLLSDVARRYQLPLAKIKAIATQCGLPILGKGKHQFIAFYKPSVYLQKETNARSLQINLFELEKLNQVMRQVFMPDYAGKNWFWHRFVWRLPAVVLKTLEACYLSVALVLFSHQTAYEVSRQKIRNKLAERKLEPFQNQRVGSCFTDDEIMELATLMRQYYVSCLWQKGDILLVDNTQVAHAGMPGAGQRKIRTMICNPLEMPYHFTQPGTILCEERQEPSIGDQL